MISGLAAAAALFASAPAAKADPLPGCVDGGYGPPADLVPPAGATECVLRGSDGSTYQARWSQRAARHQTDLSILVLDAEGAVREKFTELLDPLPSPTGLGFKLWDLDQDGRPEVVVHTANGAQNGTWSVWRRAKPGALFQQAGSFGAVATILEEGRFFLALWHMSAFEHNRRLYRFDQANALVEVAVGADAVSGDHSAKCELQKAGDLAAAGLTLGQAQERLCRDR